MHLSQNSPAVNGSTEYGNNVTKALQEEERLEKSSVQKLSKEQDHILKTFRLLIADLCQQFNGGHPGGAIGMAAIGVALWKYVMKYAPHTPTYFNRDRFVLSNGHTCLFQYTFLHLTGYKDMTFDQLKSYHSERVDALCPGHPEIEHEGIEVTTGPLGQGVANAVGLAIATKSLQANYNKPGFEVVSNHTWCMIGDACLQEGVALEAISFAGHLKLNNLTVIYDNNQITCDGSVDLTNTEDVNTKMRACGWEVIDIEDGCFDIEGLVAALHQARASVDKPTFINVKTIIGLGSAVAGDAVAHGVALGAEDVANMKKAYDFNPEEHFTVSDEVRTFFEDLPAKGQELVRSWEELVKKYETKHPDLGAEFRQRIEGRLPETWKDLIPSSFPETPTATRKASGLVINPIAEKVKSFVVGTADLTPSVNMAWKDKVDFQHPDLKTTCGITGNYSGRYIHYGVREHAMAAISNGLAAFAPNSFIPVTSSFFMFYLYAAPAVRMGALQQLQVIHAATHDSIGMGEDGPTHQPIELANLYRAMPNLLYIRPADSEETAGAWITAIEAKNTPSIISTSRHTLPQLKQTRRDLVAKGAYVLEEVDDADITLIGVGAELCHAVDTAKELKSKNIKARVISFPCQRLFEAQSTKYKRDTLRRHEGIPAVVIEPFSPNGWERWADAGACMRRFGHSLPGKAAYKYFGFDVPALTAKVESYLQQVREDPLLKGEFVDL
ncbi:hypothetical protein HBI80_039410 [Parastagonospora nodorum]|nr:hypothetical protein HBI09_087210 [Parastagonospora nodorum]KAH4122272.1 hypothetical protein HBH47_091360 [Parastagonospora nodorum]KAH4909631.1 hypothetical protein HBI80_039410 [Parastagonospora nodorum]KAH5018894.1 hypothetical protein HBI77_047800 [Parastagonospora nodorum]KAH5319209.1 hypothetical protein HBI50_122810 [Parastagonospora nodorum]